MSYAPMTEAQKHERHHEHLTALQVKINLIEQSAYENAKRLKVHAPRQFAHRSTHSQRVSQVAAWRSHLYGLHGVKRLSPFVGLTELQAMHTELHEKQS